MIQLTPDEQEVLEPFFKACDDSITGYRHGIEAAKQILLAQIVKQRPQPVVEQPAKEE